MKNSYAMLVSSVPNIVYLTNFSAFSEIEREAFVLITKNKKYIITDKRYSEAVRKQTRGFEVIETGAICFILKEAKSFFEKNKIKTLEIEENDISVTEYKLLKKSAKLVPSDFSDRRFIKKENEIEKIKKACRIGDLAFEFILTKFKVGVTEKEISDELINFFKSKGAESSFKPIIAFGTHSSVPHHETGNTRLKKNQIVLMDFGVKFENYCSDMTRTVYFGKTPDKFKKIYETILESQKEAISKIEQDCKASDIDKAARDYIKENGYPNIIHSVGHGIGLEVHEKPHLSPSSLETIKNGMVFSVEPGIYIPDFGGVRIEDLVLVREGKAELISLSKREIIEVND